MGSKNTIANWVIEHLPPSGHFYDLFCGGCAVTHAAMLSGRWEKFTINDINFMPKFFIDAVAGKYRDEKRWISRDDFFKLKDTDPYVAVCWSFGNNMSNYLYCKEIEPWKKALHYARLFGDMSLLREFGIEGDGSSSNILKHYEEYRHKYIDWFPDNRHCGELESLQSLERLQRLQRLESLESLQRLERLQSLQSIKGIGSLEGFSGDYQDVVIEPNSTVYCDIPYKGTGAYSTKYKFDYERFYEWALSRDYPVYVSEYQMPEGFSMIAERYKTVNITSGGNISNGAVEKIFMQDKFVDNFKATLF